MSSVKKNIKKAESLAKFQIELKIIPHIASPTGSQLGGSPFVPKSLDFARDTTGEILPLFCQINFANMPAILGFPKSGLFQMFVSGGELDEAVNEAVVFRYLKAEQLLEESRDMSAYKTQAPWMLVDSTVKSITGVKKDYKIRSKHTIGGRPNFVQEKVYEDHVNFLQFDSEDGIMVGENGIMHVFVTNEDLEELNFDNAEFHFDCC
ncbi:Conserved_hypothetical protein [Hexamita inflata]|uniref:DUF1963 domain-containing protein n=2 Tax=Hexamita inflata TaxID=28002 RepID=A0AA86UJ93_9EUKA|nr:Conserved hypothetical protein [Hexamita inflata]